MLIVISEARRTASLCCRRDSKVKTLFPDVGVCITIWLTSSLLAPSLSSVYFNSCSNLPPSVKTKQQRSLLIFSFLSFSHWLNHCLSKNLTQYPSVYELRWKFHYNNKPDIFSVIHQLYIQMMSLICDVKTLPTVNMVSKPAMTACTQKQLYWGLCDK